MKVLALLLCFVVAAFAVDQATVQSFIAFQHQYGKFYATPQEFNHRLAVFSKNLEYVAQLQKTTNQTEFGITKFMDLSRQEFFDIYLMKNIPEETHPADAYVKIDFNTTAPNNFDWRSRGGIVTPVYNQGQCGSCWAFAATESIESMAALKGKGLHSLSMQQIVSCDKNAGGCNGGSLPSAYKYVISAGGIEPYAKFPYTAKNTPCTFNAAAVEVKLSSYHIVTTTRNEGEMVNWLAAHGPLAIGVCANNWQFYKNGVMQPNTCAGNTDHAVYIVGYNTGANPGYWTIRNSWGADWGIGGYINLAYGKNTCNLANDVEQPVIA